MQKFLPLFPLELIVYPGEKLNLHIYEPRYLQLFNDLKGTSKTFAIPCFIKGQVAEYATEMSLVSIEKEYPDGKMDVRTKGVGVVRILHFMKDLENKPYSGGVVSEEDTECNIDYPLNPHLKELLIKMQDLLGLTKPLFDDISKLNAYAIAHYVGFSMEDKYHMLTIKTEKQRQGMIYQHLFKSLPVIRQNVEVINRIKLNGHFRNEIPPSF